MNPELLMALMIAAPGLVSLMGRSLGKQRTTYGSARLARLIDLARSGMLRSGGLLVGDFWGLPVFYNHDAPAILVSPAGSGKGTSFILVNMLRFGLDGEKGSMVALDPKGELAAIAGPYREKRGRKVIRVNPWNLHGQRNDCYNTFDDLDPCHEDFADECGGKASAFVSRDGREHGNTAYFKDTAVEKLKVYIGAIKILEPPERQNPLVLREYILSGAEDRRVFWEQMKSLADEEDGAWDFVARGAADFENMSLNAGPEFTAVLSTMRQATAHLDSAAMRKSRQHSDFTFAEVKEGNADLVMMVPAERMATHAADVRSILNDLFKAMLSAPYARNKVWFCLDEAATLGRYEMLEQMMALGRGFKCWLTPVYQSRSQMKGLFNETTESLFSNAGMQLTLACQDTDTMEHITKMCGKTTVETQTVNEKGTSKSEAVRDLKTGGEVRTMPAIKSIALIGNLQPIELRKRNYWDWPKLRSRAKRSPFHGRTPRVPVSMRLRSLWGRLVRVWAFIIAPPLWVSAPYVLFCVWWVSDRMGWIEILEARAGPYLEDAGPLIGRVTPLLGRVAGWLESAAGFVKGLLT